MQYGIHVLHSILSITVPPYCLIKCAAVATPLSNPTITRSSPEGNATPTNELASNATVIATISDLPFPYHSFFLFSSIFTLKI